MNILETQHLLERLGSLLRAEARNLLLAYGLQPVQFEALHYLFVCNHYSDTPMGVTEYLGQTKGSVSQTLKVLEAKGFIEKVPDKDDKRVVHMHVTEAGHEVIQNILPSPLLMSASRYLSDEGAASIEATLRSLLKSVQKANDFKTFGQCFSCVHHIRQPSGQYLCGLTNEALSNTDINLICRDHKSIS
jgi:DNA-binding MarR family transcriptional regulator